MAVRIKFDNNHIPMSPTFVLANRNGNKLAVIPALHINVSDNLNAAMEAQFEVQKEYNGVAYPMWDELVDFKLAWCPEWDQWFELHVETKDGDSVTKSVSAVSLGEAELSQINLYNIEINTETDIDRDDYVVTVLYDENNPKGSLLNRIMEKAPHYSIGHVDDSIADIQRTFSFSDTTILDAFNAIAEEIDCLFVIDSGSALDGSIARKINVYDMESVCRQCGYRGVFTGYCPECGSDDVAYGYGEDTNIYVSSENLTDEITYTSNVDSVKNCFRLIGGDDLMTAAIASCNPNGSSYMWYFTDAMRSDMSDELQAKLSEYDAEYQSYTNEHQFSIPGALASRYNTLVNKYKTYRSTLNTISNPIVGYSSLMNAYYDTIDFEMLLRNELMPSVEISGKTAATEAAKLTSAALSPAAVTNLEICSLATASSSVQSVAKQIVDSNYQVKVNGVSFSDGTWTGNFTVTNYSDEDDTATSSTVSVTITDDQETYLNQRISNVLSKADDQITDASSLFKANLGTFQAELRKHCLANLNSLRDICQSCLDILIEQGVANDKLWGETEEEESGEEEGESQEEPQADLYTEIYLPYYNKLNAIISEVALRESELAIICGVLDENGGVVTDGMQTVIQNHNADAQEHLDFDAYLGTDLMKELAAYRREDTYENDNFITDGLSNSEIFANALEFIELAKKEIYKSATLQHTITSTLKNLLVMKEFSSLTNQFAVGNWLSVGVAGKVYRLRLMSYEIDFDNLENINVEFTDVVETIAGANDLESILKSAASMATSFTSVKRQANRGGEAKMTLSDYIEKGLALTTMKIINSADNQNVTMDQHGLLCRELVPYNETYDERQLKIINRGLYLTDDGWRTSRAGIGDFLFYDPADGQLKNGYGVVADMLIGNLILSEEVGIYNRNNTITLDKNGLIITTTNTGTNDTAFLLRKMVNGEPQNVIWFDTDGNANFRGNFSLLSEDGEQDVGEIIEAVIIGVDVEYNQNQSTTVPPEEDDPGWQTNAPAWRDGYYIWQRTATTTPDGTTYSDPVCISGRDGTSVGITSIMYAVGTNGNVRPSSGWSATLPEVDKGDWLWVETTYTNGATATNCSYIGTDGRDGKSVAIQSISKVGDTTTVTFVDSDGTTKTMSIADGTDGTNGTKGDNGYVHIAWATNVTTVGGTLVVTGFSRSVSTGKSYLGIYTDNIKDDSTNENDYSWSLIKGVGISSVTEYYALNDDKDNAPTTGSFSVGVKTPTSTQRYVWNFERIAYTDGSVGDTDKHIVAMYGAPGAAGKGISSITDYYAINNSTTAPADNQFSTTVQTPTSSNKYLWNYEYVLYTDSTHSTTGKRVIGTYGEKGNTGTGVSMIVEQYCVTTISSGLTNDTPGVTWSEAQPEWESGKYIWTRSMITWTDNQVTYTPPVLAQAINGANQAVEDLDTSLNQTEVFNRLTNNGQAQGIVLENGQLYVNATYMQTGTLALRPTNESTTSARIRIYNALDQVVGYLNSSGFGIGDTLTEGLNIDIHGDLCIGRFLTAEQMPYFTNNGCGFQINKLGQVKAGGGIQLWYSNDYGETMNYVRKGTVRGISDGVVFEYYDGTNRGSYIELHSTGLTISPAVGIASGGTGATTASGARTNLDVYGKDEVYTKSEVNGMISSGGISTPISLANGGTGVSLSSTPSMLVNLGSTTADTLFKASPRPGITGTLGAGNGGTGQTSLADSANALINALTIGDSALGSNDYIVTQYANGGTTNTNYYRRPANLVRVGGLTTARKLKVALGTTTDATFDGTADQTSIPISGTLGAGHGGTGQTTLKDSANALINALDSGTTTLTSNDYIVTQWVGGGTTDTRYVRRPAINVRVGGLTSGRYLKVALGSTTDVTFDGTADQTSIPISGTLAIGHGGTGATTKAAARSNLGVYSTSDVYTKSEVDSLISSSSSITTPVSVSNGGTGLSSLTSGSALIGNGTGNVSLRSITNNTYATAVSASTNLITANTLYYHTGNSNISTVGTISSGTWQGSAVGTSYGGTGATSASGARTNLDVYSTGTVDSMVSAKLSTSKLLTTTVTGTTTSGGNVDLGISVSRYYILSIHGSDTTYIFQPFGYDGINWHAHVTNSTGTVQASKSVTAKILYYDTQ